MDFPINSNEAMEDLSPLVEKMNNLIRQHQKSQQKASEYLANVKSSPILLKNYFQNVHLRNNNEIHSSPELQLRPKSDILETSEIITNLDESPVCEVISEDTINPIVHSHTSKPISEQIESSPTKVIGIFHEPGENVENKKKFPYLKKSCGRRFKGFRKKTDMRLNLPMNEIKLKSVLIKPNSPTISTSVETQDDYPDPLNAFERLEEKVGHPSFISTSSSVKELLHYDELFSCSTPTPHQEGSNKIEFKQNYFNEQHKINMSPTYVQTVSQERHQNRILQSISNVHSSIESSPCSTPRVKFQRKGAKVLEYDVDDKPNVIQNQSIYSEDSVINISDVDVLSLLPYNFQVIHEVTTSSEQILLSPKLSVARNCIQNQIISRKENVNILSSKAESDKNNVKTDKSSLYSLKRVSSSADKDLLSEKLLLQARTDELNKEIKKFKLLNDAKENQNKISEQLLKKKETKSLLPKRPLNPLHHLRRDQETRIMNSNNINSRKFNDDTRLRNENCELKKRISFLEKKISSLEKEELIDQVKNFAEESPSQLAIGGIKRMEKRKPVAATGTLNKPKASNNFFQKSKLNLHTMALGLKIKKSSQNSNRLLKVGSSTVPNNSDILPSGIVPDDNLPQKDIVPNEKLLIKNTDDQKVVFENNLESSERAYKRESINLYDAYNSEFSKPENKDLKSTGLKTNEYSLDDDTVKFKNYNIDNVDFKRTIYSDRTVIINKKDNTVRTIYKEGKEVRKCSNGQEETYLKDGSFYVLSPDRSSNYYFKDGSKRHIASDGTRTNTSKDGTKEVFYPNGIKAICTDDQSKWIFPNGTIKIQFRDGSTETTYPDGTLRFKSKDGIVVMR